MGKKEVVKVFKIYAPGGKATPAPPLGPALGGAGVNPGQFVQQFNAATAKLNGKVVGCVITSYSDRSFTFITKTPPASIMLMKAAGIEGGSGEPNKVKKGKVTRKQVREIAEFKLKDMNAFDVEAAARSIAGTARSMGIEVID